ncbi:hypothetical protein IT401_01120 [Candidatus Nomurabacteria bacterium]|nr:hypothetical protein [Candidatus Nomurabacteria bacterium]
MKKTLRSFLIIILLVGIALLAIRGTREQQTTPPSPAVPTTEPSPLPVFPQTLSTTYIHPVEWPPSVQFIAQPFSCETTPRAIGGRMYCVSESGEGAAGSTYTTYTYTTAEDAMTTRVYTFTLRSVQCYNYDDPEQSACLAERASFSPDSLFQ